MIGRRQLLGLLGVSGLVATPRSAAAQPRAARPFNGLTTGVGALRNVPTDVTPGDGTSHALRLWRSHATGVGGTYDDATARAAMAIRLHQITSGRSGVSAELPYMGHSTRPMTLPCLSATR